MKLNKQDKEELLRIYETWWISYLTGDVKTYDSYLDDEFRFVGSTNNEEFLSRKDSTDFFDATADQLAGKAEKRNTIRNIDVLANGLVLITELADAYVFGEPEWVFYSRFRFTCLLRNTENGWRFIYQHFSAPDSKAQEGETLGLEQISKENQDLRDAIKRRTVELEQKSRELEIEAALERIRAIAMGMQKSEGLMDVVKILNTELKTLGFTDIRNTIINIFNDPKEYFLNYDYSDYGVGGINKVDYNSHPSNKEFVNKMREASNEFMITEFTGKELDEWRKWRIDQGQMPDSKLDQAESLYYYEYSIGVGSIGISTFSPVSADQLKILNKIRNVFDLAYRRYTDIKEAEAHAREAQIELALERVRARAMAMQKSEELSDLVNTVFTELTKLDFALSWCIINIIDEPNKSNTVWGANTDEGKPPESYYMKFEDHRFHHEMMKAYQDRKEKWVFVLEGEEKRNYDDYLFADTEFRKVSKKIQKEMRATERYVASFTFCDFGGLQTIGEEPLSEDNLTILNRFGKVFDLTYTRFNDLQKAEAQAREAQIEAALEKVRARAMSMQRPEELKDVAVLLRKEMGLLGVEELETSSIYLVDNENTECWYAIKDVRKKSTKLVSDHMTIQLQETQVGKDIEKFYLSKQKQKSIIMKGENRKEWINYCASQSSVLKGYFGKEIPERTYHLVKFTGGFMGAASPGKISNESWELLKRSAQVFSLAYTRFKDLQQAADRARETQIELALERVRSKTMAMHNSHDMAITVTTLFEEVLKLGLDDDIRCGIGILEGTERMETRSATLDQNGEVDLKIGMLDMTIHPLLKRIKNGWVRREIHYVDQMAGKDVFKYYTALNNEPNYPFQRDLNTLPKIEYHNSFSFPEGIIFAFSPNPMSEEAAKVFERFARVFGQTYRRYMDLLKAEEQAREAKIEAALERIRSQAMAMQHSDDLIKSTAILFDELEKLKLPLERCGIGIFDRETRDCQLYTTVVNDEGKTELATGITSLTVHPMLIKTFDAWEVQESLLYTLEGKELKDYYKLVSKSKFRLPKDVINKSASLDKEYYYYTPFGAGGLYVFSDIEPTNEEIKVIRRFAEVFHMTYTRYEDLQKAEARALEAVKQASLDRVRGEIASMRTSEDLNQITPLIWKELETLEVPFIRCGAFIINENKSNVQVYLTTPDGKAIGALNLPIDANELTINTVDHWRKNKVYPIHWNKEDFINWMQSMISLGQIETPEQYQGYEKPPESLDLHFIPFKQGMLYVGNTEPLTSEEVDLVKTLAEAFSIAYARYEDFVHLEEAKTRVEKALSELKSTQSQLIHAEKMASLGELTAGIAHEIQNPLNFVNNFSEVSVDLMEEMKEEMETGNTEEVNAIAEDLKQNLEKIADHGNRASFIVRGMLEHSRTNTGEKKSTDINALADEYLRLAYHGLRAKDKSFNANFKTEFDENLPKIKVISQDIGRVLLNLINNAFYAVSARASASDDIDYKPTVTVSTKKIDDKITIIVKDNGPGIPDKIKEKIFQPFFTTKPTGEGTGLGLSLSYDIITKGHKGDIKLHSKEARMDDPVGRGEGTEFIIDLPIN